MKVWIVLLCVTCNSQSVTVESTHLQLLRFLWINLGIPRLSQIGEFVLVTFHFVREIALQGVGIEVSARCARLHVRAALPAVDEKLAIRRINKLPGGIALGTLDAQAGIVSRHFELRVFFRRQYVFLPRFLETKPIREKSKKINANVILSA